MTTCDVIIVNHNSGDALNRCLEHLGEIESCQIHVVDNASTDNSLGLAQQEHQDQHIRWVANDQNLGFAKGVNRAVAGGRSDQLLILNPDCFIQKEQLLKLLDLLKRNDKVALIGCRVLNRDGSLQAASRRRLPTLWRTIVHQSGLSRWINGINLPDLSEGATVTAVNGACLLINRGVFDNLGGYDEGYPLHFEDLDLFARLQNSGHGIWYEPSVAVTHWQGHSDQSTEQVKAWKRQGLQRFFDLHRPKWEAAVVKILLKLF